MTKRHISFEGASDYELKNKESLKSNLFGNGNLQGFGDGLGKDQFESMPRAISAVQWNL